MAASPATRIYICNLMTQANESLGLTASQHIERILEHPTVVLADDKSEPHEYRLFYRLDDGRYLLAVVKLTPAGAFFASMYPTGKTIRSSHRRFRRILP